MAPLWGVHSARRPAERNSEHPVHLSLLTEVFVCFLNISSCFDTMQNMLLMSLFPLVSLVSVFSLPTEIRINFLSHCIHHQMSCFCKMFLLAARTWGLTGYPLGRRGRSKGIWWIEGKWLWAGSASLVDQTKPERHPHFTISAFIFGFSENLISISSTSLSKWLEK